MVTRMDDSRDDAPSPASHEEAEAIARVLAGDADAFEPLVQRLHGPLFGYLVALTGDREEAADVTQEAFLRAYATLGRFDTSGPFKPWLYRIATNLAISRRRAAGRHCEQSLDAAPEFAAAIPDPRPTPRTEAQREELLQHLAEALDALPEEARALFNLRYQQDLPVEQIAAIYGRRPNTIAVALHRIRLRLRWLVFHDEPGA